jgi:hypothetical protein
MHAYICCKEEELSVYHQKYKSAGSKNAGLLELTVSTTNQENGLPRVVGGVSDKVETREVTRSNPRETEVVRGTRARRISQQSAG